MNNLLIFFIFPLATIIISVVLEKALNSPVSVAAFLFAIALIITFIAYTPAELIYAIIYTLIAYIVAVLTCLIIKTSNSISDDEEDNDNNTSPCECLRNNEMTSNNNQMQYNCHVRRQRM